MGSWLVRAIREGEASALYAFSRDRENLELLSMRWSAWRAG